jgi:ribosome-associated protein
MSELSTHETTRILVQAAAKACEDKKGEDIRILELDPIDSGLADFFLIASASNDRQAVALADEVEIQLKRQFGAMPTSVEGRRQAEWILLDYVDFVVHIFLTAKRAFYDIERLRKSAKPFTPAEFDAHLKEVLAAKTRAARGKAATKTPVAPRKKAAKSSTATGKKASTAVKKAAPRKTAAKSPAKKKSK